MRGLTVAERLAARRVPPILDLDEVLETEATASEIVYQPKQSLEEPDPKLFLAVYTPYILRPMEFDWFLHRDFKPFLLGDSTYVLNTFYPLDTDRIFNLYLSKLKPSTLEEYSRLTHFCWHMKQCIPGFFQIQIEALISSISR